MNLFAKLNERAALGKPLRIGLIGAGKFGSMYLAQLPRTPGIHLVGIADLSVATARANLERVGWPAERFSAASLGDAVKNGTTHVSDDWQALVNHPEIEIIAECTGNPIAAVEHCLAAFEQGKHVVNVTVEADAFCGPLLARKAKQAGVIYSMAYGDQPALACDLVDWARTCGFPVVAAGRGHKWLPKFRESTPDTVWDHWGVTAAQAKLGGMNPKMFNAFLDGSKPAIESTAIANATGLEAPDDALTFPPGSVEDIPSLMRLKSEGGYLAKKGVVEVISSLKPDGTSVGYDIRKGVWVCIEAPTDYILCLPNGKVVQDIVLGEVGLLGRLRPGRTVVDLSTITHSTTTVIASALEVNGIAFLDAPISGMESRAVEGTLTVMCGGAREVFDRVKPFLDCIGNKILYMGPAGSGQLTKLINQLLFDINAAALGEILPMAVKLGLDPDLVGEVVNSGTGRSSASEFFVPRILRRYFSDGYPMAHAYKDLISGAELGANHCVPMPVLAAATATYQTALLKGHGERDKGAMVQVFEELLGVEVRTRATQS